MIDWCRTFKYDVGQFFLTDFIKKSKLEEVSENPVGWFLYEEVFSPFTEDLRNDMETLFDAKIKYMGVWDYFDGFVDDLGPHVDRGDVENAVVFMVPNGELTVTLHDKETKEITESRVLSGDNILILNHTEVMHDIQGIGQLVVFGLSKDFDHEMFFRADETLYSRKTLEYDPSLMLKEAMALQPPDDEVNTFDYFPMKKGHKQINWAIPQFPEHLKDAVESTTGFRVVPDITYLSDYRDLGTDLVIHKDPRWNLFGLVPPKVSLISLAGFTKISFWTGRNGTTLLDFCVYGPGDVVTFNHTEIFHSAKSLLKDQRKINVQCYSFGDEGKPFLVQYEDWAEKYGPWITVFLEENGFDQIDLGKENTATFMTFEDVEMVSVSLIEHSGGVGYVSTFGKTGEFMNGFFENWADDNKMILKFK